MSTPTPDPSISPTPKLSSSPHISIAVDDHKPDDTKTIMLIYPGATEISGETVNEYETNSSGEDVYQWYKSQLEERKFSIRNNVKTRSNDHFKAVLQGVSSTESISITIEQISADHSTTIILN